MKVLFTMSAIIDTEKLSSKQVQNAIEKSAFNREHNNIANLWALDEIERFHIDRKIRLDLL
jgi:hypothetical protein